MENKKQEYKYICEKCNFKCNITQGWEAHIKTSLHLTGERKKRKDIKEPLKCEKCNYQTKNKQLLLQHKLNEHGTIGEREKEFKFYCKKCDYGTISKDLYERHINTEKHKKIEKRYINIT
jgi:hypothetical protein